MDIEPTFSICIPNYNYERYIVETIQSVLDQTYSRFEIVVADNASTDRSVALVESFHDPRIRVFQNRYNVGFAPNLQIASMHARGDFLIMLSSDDRMKPGALERYAALIATRGHRWDRTVLMSSVETIDGEGRSLGFLERPAPEFRNRWSDTAPAPGFTVHEGRDVLATTLADLRTFGAFLTIGYPRHLWEEVEGYNGVRTIGPDKHFNYKLLAQNPDVVNVREPLFEYRMHGSPNERAQQRTLKQQLDDYLYTIELGDDFLAELGLKKDDLVRTLLDRVCLKEGLLQLVYGAYSQAFSMLAFSLAAYPRRTLSRPRFYALAGLLLAGPLAPSLARFLYRLRIGGLPDRLDNRSAS